MKLKETYIKAAQFEIYGNLGFELSLQEIDDILMETDPDYHLEEVDGYYDEPYTGGGLDTCVREIVCDTVSRRFVGMPIPTYGDGENARKDYIEALTKALKEFYKGSNKSDGSGS